MGIDFSIGEMLQADSIQEAYGVFVLGLGSRVDRSPE